MLNKIDLKIIILKINKFIMETIETKIKSIKIGDNNEYYIHYSTIEECETFKLNFNGLLGHTCCNGMGVHVKTYNGSVVDNGDIYNTIRKEYKSN